MLDPLPEHAIEGRQVLRRDQQWTGTLTCSCGWTMEVGPFPATLLVSDALAAAWAGHLDHAERR